MKKKLLLITLLVVMQFLLAETIKLAVIQHEAQDKASKYLASNNGINRDLKTILKKHSAIELLDVKKTKALFKAEGYRSFSILPENEKKDFFKKLDASVAIWSSISSSSSREFNVTFLLANLTKDSRIEEVRINVTKKSKDRQKILIEKLLPAIENLFKFDFKLYETLSEQAIQNKDWNKAIENADIIIENDPKNANAFFIKGRSFFGSKDFVKAIENYEKAINFDPSNFEYINNLSTAHFKNGDPEKATEILSEIAEESKNPKLWLKLAIIYSESELTQEEAIESYSKVLELDADNSTALEKLSFLLYEAESYEKAIPVILKALENDGVSDKDSLNDKLAQSYSKADKLSEAITQYEKVILANPSDLKTFSRLIKSYKQQITIFKSNDNSAGVKEISQKAINLIGKILENSPNNYSALISYSEIELENQNLKKAKEYAKKAKTADDSQNKPYRILANINDKLGYKKYTYFKELEEKASKAIGEEADKLTAQKKEAQKEAHRLFKEEKELLKKALARTQSESLISSITKLIASVNKNIKQTKPDEFYD